MYQLYTVKPSLTHWMKNFMHDILEQFTIIKLSLVSRQGTVCETETDDQTFMWCLLYFCLPVLVYVIANLKYSMLMGSSLL